MTKVRFTGERVIPHRYELKPMLQEHLVRYEFAVPRMKDADVIDLGCGCGYGAKLLATQGARSVVGVDLSVEAVEYAKKHYQEPNLAFQVMDVTALDYPDNYFTGAVCFEVLEHVQNYVALLKETVRVLKPGGTLILSTPNKEIWSPKRDQPINPWHTREFNRDEFGGLVKACLSEVHYWSQTTNIPGVISFILANLRLQRYYVNNHSLQAQVVEWLHGFAMKIVMLPPRLIPGAMDKNPNIILPEDNVSVEKRYYFVAVGRKPL